MAERRPLVLVDGRLERRRRTGVATVIRETRAAMAADPPADLRVRWLSGPAGLPRRGRITTAANLALDLVWLHALIPLAAWRQKADLVHAPVNWTPWWCPCPTVVTVQDLSFERLPDAYPAGFRRYASLFARRSARRARRVIATSQAGARDLGELYRVPRERIRVVPLGCRVDREPDRDREPFILCVGEFEPRKRVLHLLAAHKRYFTSAPTDPPVCRLVLAGSGGSEEQAVRRAAHPGVDVLGFVDEDDLAELYRRATLFVSVSDAQFDEFVPAYYARWYERFGLGYFGCCDPLHNRMASVRKIPNVRKVSMSPWAKVEAGAEAVGSDFVFSRKPNPAMVAMDTWVPELAEKDFLEVLAATRANGCPVEFTLKDISTVRNDPRRLWEWAEIAARMVRA